MRRLKIEHRTTYEFGTPVILGPHQLLIWPREGHDVRIESSALTITPKHQVRWHRDIHGNTVGLATFSEPASTLHIASEFHIEHFDESPLDFLLAESAVNHPFQYPPAEHDTLIPFRKPCFPLDALPLAAWIGQFWRTGSKIQTFSLLDRINRSIGAGFAYARRDEPGVQSPQQTLTRRAGSCRDFATLFLEACRSLGLASRFASGYLHDPLSYGQPGSTHAWAEVYLPGAGWKGFDSTTGEMTGSNHITVAVSHSPAGVPPVSGSFTGPAGLNPKLFVGVQVTPR